MVLFQQHSTDTFLRSAVMVEIFIRKKLMCQQVTSGNRKKMNCLLRDGAVTFAVKNNFRAQNVAICALLFYPFDFQYRLQRPH